MSVDAGGRDAALLQLGADIILAAKMAAPTARKTIPGDHCAERARGARRWAIG
jgi:hypothetical protein